MGINDRPGPGESVFRIRGAGEATGEDVEGHARPALRATEDEDVEGHARPALRATEDEDEDVEGHRASVR